MAKVNKELITDAQQLSMEMLPELKDQLVAYVKAHPDVAARLEAGKADKKQ